MNPGESAPPTESERRRKIGVIHQPYFMPWLGYFSKLYYCDVFVVLDRVHFTKGHFLDRTRITNMHGDIAWLSLPTGQNFETPIADVRLRPPDSKTGTRLLRTVESSYATAHHFEAEWPFLESLLASQLARESPPLLSLNLDLVSGFLGHVGIRLPQLLMASDVTQVEDTTGRILEICRSVGITDLVIGAGRSQAVHELHKLQEHGVDILLQDYAALHPVYSQARRRSRPFCRGLSIIDALFNVGARKVREYLTAPAYAPVALSKEAVNRSEANHESRV